MKHVLPIASLLLASMIIQASGADPGWWATRGVKSGAPASNLSPANIGQAKHMAAMALAELETKLASADHQALVAAVTAVVDLQVPVPAGHQEGQRGPLLNGQLKALSKPFYDCLRRLDPAWLDQKMQQQDLLVAEPGSDPPVFSPYPWSVSATDDSNKAVATVGQLKAAFSLPLELLAEDTDRDGMPDWWEAQYQLDPNDPLDAGTDLVGDDVSNLIKFRTGRNPRVVALPDSSGALAFFVHTPLE